MSRRLTVVLMALATLALAATTGVAAGALPDGRRWEMVTPVQKDGVDVLVNTTRVRAAVDGDAVAFASLAAFGDALANPLLTEYVGVRGSDGWSVHATTPPQEPLSNSDLGKGPLAAGSSYQGDMSPDLNKAVFLAKSPLTDDPNTQAAKNLYLREDLLSPGVGSYSLLTQASTLQEPDSPSHPSAPLFAGASSDLNRVYFESRRNLTAEAETGGVNPLLPKLYEWVGGVVRLAGILPASEGGGAATGSEAGQGTLLRERIDGAVSTDGSRVVFTAPDTSGYCGTSEGGRCGALYVRDDRGTADGSDDVTFAVSASERTDCAEEPVNCTGAPAPDPSGSVPATFWAATPDDSQVFFTSQEQLTDDDHNLLPDLYRWDLNASAGKHLTRISVDNEPVDGDGVDVVGAIGVSDDGSYVYFAAGGSGELVSGGPLVTPVGPTGGGGRIYVWHEGVVHVVGGVDFNELPRLVGADGWSALGGPRRTRVTPDGKRMVFMTVGSDQLLGYDQGNTCKPDLMPFNACNEVYAYDATANGGEGALACASCKPDGLPATGNATFVSNASGNGVAGTSHLNHPISDDGRFVFFTTEDGLVPDDTNGKSDAYEYDTLTGRVHLLSGGQGDADSYFLEATPDGHDVFFTTREHLVSRDSDQSADLYDARIGGFVDVPPASATPACESVDVCRGGAVAPATLGAPASVGFEGLGNPIVKPKPKPVVTKAEKLSRALKACRRHRRGQRKRCEAQARKRYGTHGASKSGRAK